MVNFFIFNAILFFLILIGFIDTNNLSNIEFFSKEHTTILKGIGALLVLWGHVAISNNIKGVQFIAAVGVSLFLICSGYGLEESFKKKSLKFFWRNKILNVIIPYYLITFVGYIINNYNIISKTKLFQIFTFQTQWYINFILINYIIFFLVTVIFKNNFKRRFFCFVIIYIIWFVIDAFFFSSITAPFLRGRQIFAFMIGIVISHTREKSYEYIIRYRNIIINLVLGILFMYITNLRAIKLIPVILSNFMSLFTVVPLAIVVIGITMNLKFVLKNIFLKISGIFSYYIFLIHSNCLYLTNSNVWKIFLFYIVVYGMSYIFNITYNQFKERFY